MQLSECLLTFSLKRNSINNLSVELGFNYYLPVVFRVKLNSLYLEIFSIILQNKISLSNKGKALLFLVQGVQEKLSFLHNSLQPLPRLHRRKRPSKLSNAMRVYSHSYWLVIFCVTNSSRVLERKRWQTLENSWKKTQYLTPCNQKTV